MITKIFEGLPEIPAKNKLRYFLAFNPIIPKSIQDLSPIKGYELHRKLKKGDIVIDAGAYPGDYTIYAAKKVGETGKVIAFEPNPTNRIVLERNIKAFGLKNVIVVPKGLGETDGVKLQMAMDGLHSNAHMSQEEDEEGFIHICTLDAELKRLGISRVDVIKMDIEGAEIKAIQGCVETIKNCKPYILIASYHLVDGKVTHLFLKKFLEEKGYHVIADFPKHLTTYGSWEKT